MVIQGSELTFVREFNSRKAYHKAGVPTLDAIYFPARTSNDNRQASLIDRFGKDQASPTA